MEDKNTILTRSYIDNFSMKEMAYKELAPKYFEGIEINKLNIGLLGLTIEQIGNFTEDAFNTASTLIKEAWPNRAQLPESIYSHAAIFQLSSSFAVPSTCQFVIVMSEKEIFDNGKHMSDGYRQLVLSADTRIRVEDIFFTLDYDIIIKVGVRMGKKNYSAQYDITSYNNSVSTVKDPYLRIRVLQDGYVGIFVEARQMAKTVVYENIINNSKINYPVIDVKFTDQLAGFDVFYKPPTAKEYTQLEKRLVFTAPKKTPFCYYKVKDENTISLTFSPKETYFQPAFNSELMIHVYTTTGEEGSFERYTGSDVIVIPSALAYPNNENLFLAATPLSPSVGGKNKLSLEELQSLCVEGYSTAMAYTTEHDLMMYFQNYKNRFNSPNEILFIKKRDDITERLFSAYFVMKKERFIYPTNTLFIDTNSSEFDLKIDENQFVLKPGHVFRLGDNSRDTARLIPDRFSYDDISDLTDPFIYTNPFLIGVSKKPNVVGYYMTIVNDDIILDFDFINNESFIQFVINKITISRGFDNEGKYLITVPMLPSITTDEVLVDNFGDVNNRLRVMMTFLDKGVEVGYIELIPTSIDKSSDAITFQVEVATDDYITSNNKFRCTNLKKITGEPSSQIFIPMKDCDVKVYTLYKSDTNPSSTNKFSTVDTSLLGYVETNSYSSYNNKVTFIRPMNMLRSTITFDRVNGGESLDMVISTVPFIKASIVADKELFKYFITTLSDQYDHLSKVIDILQNNTHIDLKFYNTYGRSKNFVVGDKKEPLNQVNMSLRLRISTVDGTDSNTLIKDLKMFIKDYIERLNTKGTNALYISNLSRDIENNFKNISHHVFLGLNGYSVEYQTVQTRVDDISLLNKEDRRFYIPEMLVINEEDIFITIDN